MGKYQQDIATSTSIQILILTNNKLSMTSFKEELVHQLANISELITPSQQPLSEAGGHHLEEVGSLVRRRCYARNLEENGNVLAVKTHYHGKSLFYFLIKYDG